MCREPKNPIHPDGCRCTECGLRAYELEAALNSGVGAPLVPTQGAWLDRRHKAMDETCKRSPMMVLEDLTPGGSEYVGDPERCAEYVLEGRERLRSMVVKLVSERNALAGRLLCSINEQRPFPEAKEEPQEGEQS